MDILVILLCIIFAALITYYVFPRRGIWRLSLCGWATLVTSVAALVIGVLLLAFARSHNAVFTKYFAYWLVCAGIPFVAAGSDYRLFAFMVARKGNKVVPFKFHQVVARLAVALFGLFWIAIGLILIAD